MGIHKGTKLTDNPKDRTLKFRLDAITDQKLAFICEQTGLSKAEVVRNGIDEQYAKLKK